MKRKIRGLFFSIGIAGSLILGGCGKEEKEPVTITMIHAWGGNINLDVFDNGTVQLIFKDPGPGIPDLEKAMTPGWSTANQKAREMGFGAGMGLPNMKNVSDTFDIQSSSAGTTITMTFTEAPQ